MAKDVRIIVKGVPDALPEDRIAFLVNGVMGHRAESVEVESVSSGPDPEVAEAAVPRIADRKSREKGE